MHHAALALALVCTACAPFADIERSDGTRAAGTIQHEDDDIIVLRKVTLNAPRSGPAPFKNRWGRASYRSRQPELSIPKADVVRLRSENKHARRAGIAGAVMFPLGLTALIPSAIARANCGSGSDVLGCSLENIGVTIGTIVTAAGLAAGIAGWVIWANSERDEAGPATLGVRDCGGKPCAEGIDTDGDGLLDSVDRCPRSRGDAAHAGCAVGVDSDGDRLLDEFDKCPDVPQGDNGYAGCPAGLDTDGDGLLDMYDKCPNHRSKDSVVGCPLELDSDGDGLLDVDDRCPLHVASAGDVANLSGCPPNQDGDRDGVLDAQDRCPLVTQTAGGKNGCPPTADVDGDKVPDMDDACLADAEDGLAPDPRDGCPATKLKVSGCRLNLSDSVLFAAGKAQLSGDALFVIKQVAREVRRRPETTELVVEGHTDSRGSGAANMQLSLERAQAVVQAMAQSGMLRTLTLRAEGKGETVPVASNATQAGRAKNRRVEFRLIGGKCR